MEGLESCFSMHKQGFGNMKQVVELLEVEKRHFSNFRANLESVRRKVFLVILMLPLALK